MRDLRSFLPDVSRKERLEAIQKALEPHRLKLGWIVDTLIPADPTLGMPSASEAGVVDQHLPRALLARDDLVRGFLQAVARLPEEMPLEPMAALQALGSKDFDLCSRVVSGAFFLNEAVCRTLGYLGQEAIRENPDYDKIIDAIAPVMERGPIYTPVTETQQSGR